MSPQPSLKDTILNTSSSSPLQPSFQRGITRSEDASRKVSEIAEHCKGGALFQHSLFCTSQTQLSPSPDWHLLNSSCPQARRAGCIVLILPGSLLLTINFLTPSFPQARSWAERKDECLYSLTVPGSAPGISLSHSWRRALRHTNASPPRVYFGITAIPFSLCSKHVI